MKILLVLLSLLSCRLKIQTNLIGDYEIFEYFKINIFNKYSQYIWLYDRESYRMNFPKSITGLEDIIEKSEYIAGSSHIDAPTWDDSIIPAAYKDEKDFRKMHQLITEGKMGIFTRYVIGNKRMRISCSQDGFCLYITHRY